MTKIGRRQFNKILAGGIVSAPVAFVSIRKVSADTMPMVDPEGPTAKALQYVVLSEKEGVNCASCILYTDDGTEEKGGCTVFPAQLVPAEAWCSAYQPKA